MTGDVPVRTVGAVIRVSAEMLADAAPLRSTLERQRRDWLFELAVGRSRWNPNPMPRFRLFRWLPG